MSIQIFHHTNDPKYELETEIKVINYISYGLFDGEEARYMNRNPGSPKCNKILFSWGKKIYGELEVEKRLKRSEFLEIEKQNYKSVYKISSAILYDPPLDHEYINQILDRINYKFSTEVSDENYLQIIKKTKLSKSEINEIEYFDEKITDTERNAIRKQRIGQSKFRNYLLQRDKSCIICGISNPKLLIASHLKPWSISNNTERLDPNNGVILCANHDKMFDLGFFTFDNKGEIKVSTRLDEKTKTKLFPDQNLFHEFNKRSEKYRVYHHKNVFKSNLN